jgi:hypothetical protein
VALAAANASPTGIFAAERVKDTHVALAASNASADLASEGLGV